VIRVLVAEDSRTLRDFLVGILSAEPDLQVIATAADGVHAVEAVRRLKPDVVTMDIHMPRMDGLEATRRIMEGHPVPIVIVSGTSTDHVATTFRAVEAGALAFVPRPHGIGHVNHPASAGDLVQMVRLMAEIRVVRRWPRPARSDGRAAPAALPRPSSHAGTRMVAIGGSTGGPLALQTILAGLRRDFPVPVLAVQHISPGFVQGFVEWLGTSSALPVHLAAAGDYALPGHVYIAPDGAHMGLGRAGTIVLDHGPPQHGQRPAVSYLFRSLAETIGADVAGVLLSGMGADGAAELKLLRDAGAVTIAQNKESSVVHGMPGVAIALDGATHVLAPDEIAQTLLQLVPSPAPWSVPVAAPPSLLP
jgi:two-component system, chemotaxis family, protein-glutamate methylesterase/glutaminase